MDCSCALKTDWCAIQGPGLGIGNRSGKEQRMHSVPKQSGVHIISRHTFLRAVIPTPFSSGQSSRLGPLLTNCWRRGIEVLCLSNYPQSFTIIHNFATQRCVPGHNADSGQCIGEPSAGRGGQRVGYDSYPFLIWLVLEALSLPGALSEWWY